MSETAAAQRAGPAADFMSLQQLYKPRRRASRQQPLPPVVQPSGPETISSTVRELVGHKVRLWDDPLDRTYGLAPALVAPVRRAVETAKALVVTIEKAKGQWTITNVKEL